MQTRRRPSWRPVRVPISYDRHCAQRCIGLLVNIKNAASIVDAVACVRMINGSVVSRFEADLLRPVSVLETRGPDGSTRAGIVLRTASSRFPLKAEVGETRAFNGSALRFLVIGEDPPNCIRHTAFGGCLSSTLDEIQAAAVGYASALLGESINGHGRSFLDTVASRFRCIANSNDPPGPPGPSPPPVPPPPPPPAPPPRAPSPAALKKAGGRFVRPEFKYAEDLFCYFAKYWVDNTTGDLTPYAPGITHETHWPLPLVYGYPRAATRG